METASILFQEAASRRIDEIYRYSRDRWGDEQAGRYIAGLFAAIEGIKARSTISRPIPAQFKIDGSFFRYGNHFVYWRRLGNGDIDVLTVLHAQMHQLKRLREDSGT